jgi:hypothetical protein
MCDEINKLRAGSESALMLLDAVAKASMELLDIIEAFPIKLPPFMSSRIADAIVVLSAWKETTK